MAHHFRNAAARAALMRGDLKNALIAETPGGIEAQEAQGQRDFVASDSLPCRIQHPDTEQAFLALGFVFGDPIPEGKSAPLFRQAKLPDGWRKVATDHSMWTNIVDSTGTPRVAIFYKAAFYDRAAFMRLI